MRWTEDQYADFQKQHEQRQASASFEATAPAARGVLPKSKMNKTESAYSQHLEMMRRAGRVLWYRFEPMKLRLADGSYYKPDFGVMTSAREFELHETKGFWREAARVRIKVAAELYPFRFIAVTAKPKKDGGGWSVEEF